MRLNPFDLLVRAAVWLLGVALLTLLLLSGQATRWDNALYDWHLRHWSYAPADDVVIVAIDPQSLAKLGRWPWPRSLHAKMIDRLTAAGVRGIGFDVTTAEVDAADPGNDELLAQAIKRNGQVVVPMFAEQPELGGMPEEMLPIPSVMQAAAAVGQVDVPRDADGLVRGAYLKAGLGRPYWPLLALATYQLDAVGAHAALPGLRDTDPSSDSPYLWMRDHYILLRYAGPSGSFGRVSFADVLDGSVPAQLLRHRWVLIGATAEGMGDTIPTPSTRGSEPMPGVEYQANVLESLLHGRALAPLNLTARFLLDLLVLALPVLLQGLPGLRKSIPLAIVALPLPLLLSVLLLRLGGFWWPPADCMLVTAIGLGAWHAANWRQNRTVAGA